MGGRRLTSEQRRRQIAEAALKVIAEQGLGRFTTAAIAAEVGLTDGALFRHFSTKEDIVLAAMDRAEELLFADFPPQVPDPLERLRLGLQQRISVVAAHPFVARVVFSEDLVHAAGPAGAAKVDTWRMRTVAFVHGCLAEAVQKGAVRDDVPVEHLVLLVQGLLMGLVTLGTRFGEPGMLPALAAGPLQTLDTLLRR